MGNYPPRPATVAVNVTSTDPLDFHLSTNLPMGPGNEVIFKNGNGHEAFDLRYELVGAPGFVFPDDPNEACYVSHGSKTDCPKKPGPKGQFEPRGVEDGGRTLRVYNKNNMKQDFSYLLRITDGSKVLELDPPGSNQNGGGDDN